MPLEYGFKSYFFFTKLAFSSFFDIIIYIIEKRDSMADKDFIIEEPETLELEPKEEILTFDVPTKAVEPKETLEQPVVSPSAPVNEPVVQPNPEPPVQQAQPVYNIVPPSVAGKPFPPVNQELIKYVLAASMAPLASIAKVCRLARSIDGNTACNAINMTIAKTTITANNSTKVKPRTLLVLSFIFCYTSL